MDPDQIQLEKGAFLRGFGPDPVEMTWYRVQFFTGGLSLIPQNNASVSYVSGPQPPGRKGEITFLKTLHIFSLQ